MKKDIVVYWSVITPPPNTGYNYYINVKEPQPVIKEFSNYKQNIAPHVVPGSNFLRCPAVINSLKKTFYFSSPFHLGINFNNGRVTTSNYGQEFYDRHITIEYEQAGYFQLNTELYLFTEEESLTVRQRGPSLSNSAVANNLITIEGEFDIGKWFRSLNGAYIIKSPGSFNILKDDPLFYIDFYSSKNIIFKKFYFTPEIFTISRMCVRNKVSEPYLPIPLLNKLNTYYSEFKQSKIKSRLVKLIKENLLD